MADAPNDDFAEHSDTQTVAEDDVKHPERKASQAFKKLVKLTKDKERVLYPRHKLPPGSRPGVVGGQPITEEKAKELRITAFGTAACAPRSEWTRTSLFMRSPEQPLAYGLVAPRNGVRSLLAALQAHIVKHLLFDSRDQKKSNVPPETYLRPSEERQEEALWHACSEVLWRCGGGGGPATVAGTNATTVVATEPSVVVALPSDQVYVQHSSHYYQDGVTEKLHIFGFDKLEDLQIFLKRYIYMDLKSLRNHYEFLAFAVETLGVWSPDAKAFDKALGKMLIEMSGDRRARSFFIQRISLAIQRGNVASVPGTTGASAELEQRYYIVQFQEEPGPGAMLLLYSAILSRGCDNIKKDLDGKLTYLVSSQVEGSLNVAMLLLTGRATPYLHNGVIYVGDEDHYAMPQFGILARSAVGLLIWYGNEDSAKNNVMKQQPGSRLKTPALPIWVTSCAGHYGILFNTNRELLRNYHAERRFDIHYYTCGGCHVLLSVDTRSHDDAIASKSDDITATPLEKLIHTKWQDAKVTWTGPTPYIGEASAN